MNTPPSDTPSSMPAVVRRPRLLTRPRIAMLALVALVAIVAGSALTASSFTSRAGTNGDRFASAPAFVVRNATAPVITGTAADGSTLTATPGTWKGSPTSYTYEWQRCNATATTCTTLSSTTGTVATNQSRALSYADAGTYLRMKVTAANALGSVTSASAVAGRVTSSRAYNIDPPTISGSVAGQTLTLDKGTWGGTAPINYSYQWYRCDAQGANCLQVTGGTGTTLATTMDDTEAVIRATVTANNGSSASASVDQAIRYPDLTAAAGIVGSPEVGMRMTSSTGFNGPVIPSSVTYRWQRCSGSGGTGCSDIAGATEANYTVTTADIGSYLRYHLKATAKDGNSAVDKDSVVTDSTVKARRVASVGNAPMALATAPDGRLFVGGGTAMKFAKAYTGPIAAVAADGNGELAQVLKTSFARTDMATTAKVIGDGKGGYVVGATKLKAPDGSIRSLLHIRGDGTVDTSYPDVDNRVTTLLRGKDNTIYVGGLFTTLGGQARSNVGAVSASGTVTSWNPNASHIVYGLASAPGGRIYVAGDFQTLGGQAHYRVGLVMADGTVVHSFAPPPSIFGATLNTDCSAARNLSIAPEGTIYVTGFNCIGAPPRVRGYIAALKPDGTPLGGGYVSPQVNDNPHTVFVSGNTIYVGGFFDTANGSVRNHFAAFDRNTGALLPWAPNFNGTVWAFERLGNRLYASGEFTTVDGAPRSYAAAFDTSTATPTLTNWAPQLDKPVNGMTIEDSAIYLTGEMNWYGVQQRSGLAVLDADGQLTPTATSINTGWVDSIAINGSDTYLGGNFTQLGGQARNGLAKVNTDSGAVSSDNYSSVVTGPVNSVVYAGNSLWVGGNWTTGLYPNLARFTNGDATMPTVARPAANRPVQSMAVLPGNRLAIGGTTAAGATTTWTNPVDATTYGTCSASSSYSSIAIWRMDVVSLGGCTNGLDIPRAATVFNTNAPPSPQIAGGIYGMAVRPDGIIQAVGDIKDVVNNRVVNGVYWNADATPPGAAWASIDLNATGKAIVWSPAANAYISGGNFTTAKGVSRPYLAAHTGLPDATSWNPGANLGTGGVNALGVYGSEVFAGGNFTTYGGETLGNLLAFDATSGALIRYET
jgi:hypothetical protein